MRAWSTCFIIALVVVCSCYGIPSDIEQHSLVLRQRRELNLFGDTRKLIENLVENLRKSAQQALEAVREFNAGLLQLVKEMIESMFGRLQNLRKRVHDAISNVTDRISGAGTAVRECINIYPAQADILFNTTVSKTMNCADQRKKEVGELINSLSSKSTSVIDFTNTVLEEMKTCSEKNKGNIFGSGACLARIVIKTEAKGALFLAERAANIGRINLALITLPAALEVCAGVRLVEAGVGTVKILGGIGGCSVTHAVSTFTGNNNITNINTNIGEELITGINNISPINTNITSDDLLTAINNITTINENSINDDLLTGINNITTINTHIINDDLLTGINNITTINTHIISDDLDHENTATVVRDENNIATVAIDQNHTDAAAIDQNSIGNIPVDQTNVIPDTIGKTLNAATTHASDAIKPLLNAKISLNLK